jgi:hypothetical protein
MHGDDALHLLANPECGEYLNETVFLTSDGFQDCLRITYIEGYIDRMALMTDGLQRLALDMQTDLPKPHPPFFDPLFRFLQKVPTEVERDRQLRNFLQSERVCTRTDDDKTLVIAWRKKDA